jgi:hydrogenase expression/formation protein HypC
MQRLDGEPLAPGDRVLMEVGFAVSKVDAQEVVEALRMLELTGRALTDELLAVAEPRIE